MKTAVIIGGGLGGLFTGAILAKEGFEVTILEKNSTIGGGLQTFRRFGEVFDTGMHIIGGMQKGGNIRKICQYLGILDKVEIRDVDDNCTDEIYFDEDKTTYRIAKGKDSFVESLACSFPEEKDNLVKYVNAIYSLADETDLFNLRPSESYFNVHSDDYLMSADSFIAKYVGDRKLRSVLAYMNPLYGGRKDQTPAFIHAIINVLYINGPSRFVGGSDKFAHLLSQVITHGGGHIHVHDAVEWIGVNERNVDYVKTQSGKLYKADYYISDIHPCSLIKLLPEDAFSKAYRKRLNEIPNSYSAFGLYIKMKECSFPYINHTVYYMNKYDDIWQCGDDKGTWPKGFLLMTPPERNQGKYSRKVLITAPMSFEMVREWEHTYIGKRGTEYEKWKAQKAQTVLSYIDKLYPGFIDCVENVNTSSPLTIRDFYGVKEGALSGYSKDYKNIVLSQVPVVTKVHNLLLTGQNNSLHGFCGVPLTAINTVEAILGRNYIINEINKCPEE